MVHQEPDSEKLAAWRRAPDRDIERALTRDRDGFEPDVIAIIEQVAQERGFEAAPAAAAFAG